jgi:CHASE2 domain-containing sensor protein
MNGRHSRAGPGMLLIILVGLMWLAGDRLLFLESTYYDFLQRQQATPGSERILLVDTTSQTTDGALWDANFIAPLIGALKTAGADLIVPIEAPPSLARLPGIEQLTALAELETRARHGENNTDDGAATLSSQLAGIRKRYADQATIASTVESAGNVVLAMSDSPPARGEAASADYCQQYTIAPTEAEIARPSVRETTSALTLPEKLCAGAANAGHGQYWPDSDGVVRRTHLLVKSGDRIFPALSLAATQANQAPDGQLNKDLEVHSANSLEIVNRQIGTGPGFTSLLRFYQSASGEDAFPKVSADDLLSGIAPKNLFRNRIVLIGDLETDSISGYRTPYGNNIPGILLVATAISNLLQMDFVSRPYWLASAELAILVVLGIAILFSAPSMSNHRAVTIIGILVVLLLSTEAYLLIAHGVWVQLVTATLFVVLGFSSVHAMSKLRHEPSAAGPAAARPSNAALDNQDQLDLAFSVLRQQQPTEETKKRLYGIAMTHGKLKEYSKAERVLIYLQAIDPNYRDVDVKLKKLSGARKSPRNDMEDTIKAASEASPEMSGSRMSMGRYRLDSVLGRGAMATVYLGTDPNINRKVAIKTIALAEEFSDADLEAAKIQFRREAESAGRLNHPNIIAIYDTGEDKNVAYLAMEYFEGKPLNYYAQSANLLPPKWVLELTARAADALHYAHGQGVVHRDIKPANIIYDAATDVLKITDFGIARLTDTSRTKTGIILGTPSYMSPEQLSASAITGKSDLYSLGVTMYQLLTGTTPFRSDSIPKLMDKIVNEKHRAVSSLRDDIPLSVDVVLDQAMAKNPDDRYPNGRAMGLALRDCVASFETH